MWKIQLGSLVRNNQWRAWEVKGPAVDKPSSSSVPLEICQVMDQQFGSGLLGVAEACRAESLLCCSSHHAHWCPQRKGWMWGRSWFVSPLGEEMVAAGGPKVPPRSGCEKQRSSSFLLQEGELSLLARGQGWKEEDSVHALQLQPWWSVFMWVGWSWLVVNSCLSNSNLGLWLL